MRQAERVAVSLPKEIVQRAENAREQLGINRSRFYYFALKSYLEEFPDKDDQKLANLYQEVNKTDQELLAHFSQHSYKHLPPYEK